MMTKFPPKVRLQLQRLCADINSLRWLRWGSDCATLMFVHQESNQCQNHHCHYKYASNILGKYFRASSAMEVAKMELPRVYTWSQRWIMLLISSSDTSVPMEISAAAFTSASISSGRMSETSAEAKLLLSPGGGKRKHICAGGKMN